MNYFLSILCYFQKRKKKKSGGRGGRISDTWSVKLPVTVDPGQTPDKSLHFSGQPNEDQRSNNIPTLQGTQLRVQRYSEVLASTAPLWPVSIPDGSAFYWGWGVGEEATSPYLPHASTFPPFSSITKARKGTWVEPH